VEVASNYWACYELHIFKRHKTERVTISARQFLFGDYYAML